jgi:hypothetical protein
MRFRHSHAKDNPMSDNDKKAGDRRKLRGARQAAVIELTAAEVKAETSEPSAEVLATDAPHAADPAPEPQAMPEPDPQAAAEPELIEVPPPPAPERSIARPMAVAAIIGGLLGTAGGTLIPGWLGLGQPSGAGDIQRLQQQVTVLANRPQTASADMDNLRQKLASLEGDVARRVADAESKLAGRLGSVETGLKEATARPLSAAATPATDLSPLNQRLGALEQGLKTVDGKAEAGLKAAEPRIAAIAQQVDQAVKRMSATSAAPFFSAAQGLALTFHSGRPFVTELTAMELLGAEPAQLAPLRPLAEKGAPTLPQLAAQFTPLAGPLARAGEPEPTGLTRILQRFVKVRPAGIVGGSTPPDLVSTIEAALAQGDIAAALAAWRRLPEPARALSKGWADTAETRDGAGRSLSALQSAAIAALRNAKP